MKLVRYKPEYLESVLALHQSERLALETRLGLDIGISSDKEEADLRAIEQVYLNNGGEFLIGLLDDGVVMAMGGFQRLSGDSAELRRMRIRKDLQDRGYGSRLLKELERKAFLSGIRTISFETAKARPLTLEFYHKHGYQETGTGFYGQVETVHFSKTLDEKVQKKSTRSWAGDRLVEPTPNTPPQKTRPKAGAVNKETVMQMISKDHAEWNLLASILDAHPAEVLHSSQSPPWTSRDVYAHLARWLNNSNKDMEAYCSGGDISPHFDNIDEVNSRWQKDDSVLSLAEARNRALRAFNKRLEIIGSIPMNKWDKKLERIANYDGAEHLAGHRKYICVT